MAGLLDLFGGGGGGKDDDPYADILTPGQRNQMLTQGLLAMAGAFADAGMPSRLPIPFGSALGKAAAALGTGQEAGMKAAIENALAAQKVRDLRNLSQFRTQFFGDQDRLSGLVRDALGGAGAAPAARSPAAAPAGTYVGPEAGPGASGPIPSRPPWAPPVGLLGGGDTDLAAGSPPSASRGDSGDTDLTAGILPSASGDADLVSGGGLLAPAPNRPAPQRAALTGSAREIADNNFAGLRRPGVMAGPGAGGFQAFNSPQEGLLAVSNQLDRYASGATTGTPLTTIRQIVSTWAPPSENDTETLIRRASGVVGVSPDQPLDVANPEVKAKLTEALIRNEQGGRLPVDPSLIRPVAATSQPQGGAQGENALMRNAPFPTLANAGRGQPVNWRADQGNLDPNNPANYGPGSPLGMAPGQPGPPDTYIPPQRAGAAPTMQLAQYQPGAPSGGAAATPPQIPQIPVPPGADPAKFNALLLELARRNAAAEVLGMGNPYGSMLSVLQGSPQYKAAIESATRGAGLPFVEPEAAAKARGTYPYDIGLAANKGLIDQVNKQAEQLGAAALEPASILLSDGKGGTVERQGTRYQQMLAANGFSVPELGIKGMYAPPTGTPNIPGLAAPGASPRTPAPQTGATPDVGGFPAAGTPVGKQVFTPGETKSQETGMAAGWKALEDTHAAELAANRRDQQLGQLGEAMQGFTPGATAEIRVRGAAILRDLGLIKGDEVPSAETFQRAARQLQLAAAPRGQGSVSNYERELYGQAVESMANTPEGLAKAIDIARRLDQYDRSVAQIHRDVATENRGTPNLIEAQRRIATLGPPLSPGEIGALETIKGGKVPGPGQATVPGGLDKAAYDRLPSGAPYTAPDGSQRIKP